MSSMKELLFVSNCIKYAVEDVNTVFTQAQSIIRLSHVDTGVVRICTVNSIGLRSAALELNAWAEGIVRLCFNKYGLIPIFYKGSISVEVDNN